jgi:NADH dehydrogenase [ubiquinone] 1 alpha subcomplex assembly factor 3
MSPAGAVYSSTISLLGPLRCTPLIYKCLSSLHNPHGRPTPLCQVFRANQIKRPFTASSSIREPPPTSPATTDRGPKSTEDTVTDFGSMDVLSSAPAPTTAIDACLSDGFHLDNGLKISGGSGCLLVGGEAFSWRPWEAGENKKSLLNARGQWDVGKKGWGLLDLVWPKPGECELQMS